MKILELTRADDSKGKIAINTRHIVQIEPIIVTNNQYTGDAKTYIYTVNQMENLVVEDYESIMRMLMVL